jgi:hypothetical protein
MLEPHERWPRAIAGFKASVLCPVQSIADNRAEANNDIGTAELP